MSERYLPFTPDQRQSLIDFIATDTYPFNGVPHPTKDQVAAWLDGGTYAEWFWIARDGDPVGIMHYQDASDTHAEVHLRLRTPLRGHGIGTPALRWLTEHIFLKYPTKHRVEGWTRVDNCAMRRVFEKCGYMQEAFLRLDFPRGDGT